MDGNNNKQKEGVLDGLSLPQYMIDLEREARNVPYGDVGPFYLKRAAGETVGLRGQTSKELKFRNESEAIIYLADVLKTLPKDKSGVINIKLEFVNGKIKKLTNVSSMLNKYEYKVD